MSLFLFAVRERVRGDGDGLPGGGFGGQVFLFAVRERVRGDPTPDLGGLTSTFVESVHTKAPPLD